MYFPVSPVAPPKRTTLDFETEKELDHAKVTLGDGVAKTSERNLAEDLHFLHHL